MLYDIIKSGFFQEIPAHNKSRKVAVQNKYIFWIITYSVAVLKSIYVEELAD